MNNLLRVVRTTKMVGARQMSGETLAARVKAKQEFFQRPDGKLIHEKTNTDNVLYAISVLLTVAGVAGTLSFYYDFAFPKKG